MKKLLSIALSAILLSSLTLSTLAVSDYGQEPDYTKPTPPPVVEENVITDAPIVKDESGTEYAVVEIKNNETVKADVVADALANNVPVKFVTKNATIVLSGLSVDAADLRDLSLEMNISADAADLTVADAVKALITVSEFTSVAPVAQGEFGLTMNLTVAAPAKPETATNELPFLYYLAEDGTVYNHGFAVVTGETVSIAINHASSYVVSYEVIADAVVDAECANIQMNKDAKLDLSSIIEEEVAPEATVAPTEEPVVDTADEGSSMSLILMGLGLVLVAGLGFFFYSKSKKD